MTLLDNRAIHKHTRSVDAQDPCAIPWSVENARKLSPVTIRCHQERDPSWRTAMRLVFFSGFVTALIVASGAALAQSASPSQPSEPPAAAMPSTPDAPASAPATAAPSSAARPAGPAGAGDRRLACRSAARSKGLRGREATDDAAVCFQEARLQCFKEAVNQGKRGRERNVYIRQCLGLPDRGR